MPVIGDSVIATRVNPSAFAAAATSSTTRACTAASRTMPPFAHFGAPRLELRLHEHDDVRVRRAAAAATPGRMWRSEMNDTSIVTMSNAASAGGQLLGVSVRALTRSSTIDARIAAELPIELAVADVERDDARARRAGAARR